MPYGPISMADLVRLIQSADGAERDRLLGWYHARNIRRFGEERARWYREEYEWLKTRR